MSNSFANSYVATAARMLVLAALACPIAGCTAEVGSSAELEDVNSTSQALELPAIQRIVVNARLLGCPNQRYVAFTVPGGSYYATAEQTGGHAMVCNRTVENNWERFEVHEITYADQTKRIALKSDRGSGQYVSATNGGGSSIYANRNAIGAWESFGVASRSTGGIPSVVTSLQTVNGNFVTREDNGGSVMNADRPGIGPWEEWDVQCRGGVGEL
jgi:hypothetical protein